MDKGLAVSVSGVHAAPLVSPKAFRSTLVATLIAIFGALALVVAALVQERDNRIEAATIQAENTSRLMAGYVLQSIQKIDLVLRDVQEHVRPPDMRARHGQNSRRTDELHRLLERKLAAIPEGSVLHISNTDGELVYSSAAVVPDINVADRYHFLRQQEDATAGLVISPPLISRTTGKWAFVASRRLNFEDGSFAGIVNLVVNLDGLEKFFASLDVLHHGVVNMRDREMRLMARFPPAADEIGKPVANHPALAFLHQGLDHAVYQGAGSVDGVIRRYSFRQVGNLGLFVFAGIAEEDYLSDWRMHIKVYGLASLLLTVTLLIMLFMARRDLFERERTLAKLALEEEKFHTIADYTYDWEYWQGLNHAMLYISPSCERVTGYSPAEFQVDTELLYRIIHPDDQHLMADHLHDSSYVDVATVDFRIVRRDGEIRWIAHGCRSVYGRDGEFIGRRASNRDITERKRAEEKVYQLNDELERRVAQRTVLLESANSEIEEFSYSISHDMLVPLRAIDGFSQMLLEEQSAKLDDEGKRMLKVVRDNAQRMGKQIDGILYYLRMGKRELAYGPVDLARLAREVFKDLRLAFPERGIHLEMGVLPEAWGDREMLREVLANLLSNAIKFSRANADGVIELSGTSKEAENIYRVKDCGVGFDMQYVNKLFKVFERVHPTGQYEGSGIGLAIVKRIVNRHGGRVWAEGRVNEGAAFYFALPTGGQNHE